MPPLLLPIPIQRPTWPPKRRGGLDLLDLCVNRIALSRIMERSLETTLPGEPLLSSDTHCFLPLPSDIDC
jgi:hypothetical protein